MAADPGQVPLSSARRRVRVGQMVVLGVNGNCISGYRSPSNLIAAKLYCFARRIQADEARIAVMGPIAGPLNRRAAVLAAQFFGKNDGVRQILHGAAQAAALIAHTQVGLFFR